MRWRRPRVVRVRPGRLEHRLLQRELARQRLGLLEEVLLRRVLLEEVLLLRVLQRLVLWLALPDYRQL